MPILNSARELDPARLDAAYRLWLLDTTPDKWRLAAAILAYLLSGPERAAEEMLAALKLAEDFISATFENFSTGDVEDGDGELQAIRAAIAAAQWRAPVTNS